MIRFVADHIPSSINIRRPLTTLCLAATPAVALLDFLLLRVGILSPVLGKLYPHLDL